MNIRTLMGMSSYFLSTLPIKRKAQAVNCQLLALFFVLEAGLEPAQP